MILITEFFIPKPNQSIKLHEIIETLMINQANEHIKEIHLFCNLTDTYEFHSNDKLHFIRQEKRPQFNDLLQYANDNFEPGTKILLANSDIYFKNLEILQNYKMEQRFMCVGRHELDGQLFDVPYAQDLWHFITPIVNPKIANFFMGSNGCDNRIAYLMHILGYQLSNPSKSLIIVHNHLSKHRVPTEEFCYGPYALIDCAELFDVPKVKVINHF